MSYKMRYFCLFFVINLTQIPVLAQTVQSQMDTLHLRLEKCKKLDKQIDRLFDVYESYEKRGETEKSISTLVSALNLIRDSMGKNNEDYFLFSNLLAIQLYNSNRPKEAITIFKEVIGVGRSFDYYRVDVCFAYELYLRCLARNGQTDSIDVILPTAIQYYATNSNCSGFDSKLYEIIGFELDMAGFHDEAIKYFEKVGGNATHSIDVLMKLGKYYSKMEPEKALFYFTKAEKLFLSNTINLVRMDAYENIMLLNEKLGNIQESIKYAEIVEPFVIRSDNPQHYLDHLMKWAKFCVDVNDTIKVGELTEKIRLQIDKVPDLRKIPAYANLGFFYIVLDKSNDAIEVSLSGLGMCKKWHKEKSKVSGVLYSNLGKAYMMEDDYDEALPILYKSREIQLWADGFISPKTKEYIKVCEMHLK